MIIASMTKLVTATCCMQLVDKGLIGLDDDVRPLVPQLAQAKILRGFVGADIPYLDDNSPNHPITLRHLLTHTSGLAYANGDPDLARWAAHTNRPSHASLAGTLAQWTVPLKFAPGTGWCYGTGVDWAGYVLQCVTGQTLGAYMAQHLFAPLGMHHSSFHRRDVGEPAVVVVPTSYRDESSGELVRGDDFPWPETFEVEGGGAGLYTTAEDYAKLLAELVQEDGGRVLFEKAETVREMFRPQLTDQQRGWLTFLTDLFYEGLVPDFKRGMPLDHGISGVINMEDEPGKRRKGSMMWGGLCNSHWVSSNNCLYLLLLQHCCLANAQGKKKIPHSLLIVSQA